MRNFKIHGFTAILLLSVAVTSPADHFLKDDPIWVDPDRVSIPEPKPHPTARAHDFFLNTFFDPGGSHSVQAQNINTLGEVPDSSWFNNRIGLRKMTIQEVANGPNHDGPDLTRPWIVTKAKTDGATPGFVIKDAKGDTYYVKLDSPETPELQSSAEVISTKFLYAMGYNVPENYVVNIRPDHLRVKEGGEEKKKKLTQHDLDELVADLPRRPDGKIRVLASLQVKGKPLGGFRFFGTRSDDANDIFPHENRRELRGYRVFAAWLNHNDSDSKNTFDVYLTEGASGYIKHYLLDFGTTLGSAAAGDKDETDGYEYRFDVLPILKTAATLGIWDRPWKHLRYPDYPAVGPFEANHFLPQQWRPDYPNPAFQRLHPDDAFWAAKIVHAFSDEDIRAIVKTGEISDPDAEKYLANALIERRNRIVRFYFGLLNPLSDFQLSDASHLSFRNLGQEAGLGKASRYEYQWFRLDNRTGDLSAIGDVRASTNAALDVPRDSSPYLIVQVRTVSDEQTNWNKTVDVYIRNGSKPTIVGIERQN